MYHDSYTYILRCLLWEQTLSLHAVGHKFVSPLVNYDWAHVCWRVHGRGIILGRHFGWGFLFWEDIFWSRTGRLANGGTPEVLHFIQSTI